LLTDAPMTDARPADVPPAIKLAKVSGCPCGCGKRVTNWTQACYPVPPWDTPGLPPRSMDERCARHDHCAYRDDDPARCPICHTTGHTHCQQAFSETA